MSESIPYKDWREEGSKSFLREFSVNLSNSEFIWHRDKKDRIIEIMGGAGWKFQYDNKVPFELEEGMTILVKAYDFHRVIKGTTNLIVKITERDFIGEKYVRF